MCNCTVKDVEKLDATPNLPWMICHPVCSDLNVPRTTTKSNVTNGEYLFYDAETGNIIDANTKTK